MSSEIKTLKAKRAVLKSHLTRFESFMNKFLPESSNEFIALKARLQHIQSLLDEFNRIQFEIEILSSDSDDEVSIQSDEREHFENIYYKLINNAQQILSKGLDNHSIQSKDSHSMQSKVLVNHSNHSSINSLASQSKIGSSKRVLDTFKSVIHNKANLSDINKFHYLRLELKGEAAEVLRDMHIAEDSYEIAWQSLLDRYEDEEELISHYLDTLTSIPAASKESSSHIRQIHDTMTRSLRALERLGEPTQSWDTLVIYLISDKLDSISKRKWQSRVTKTKKPKLVDFKAFLTERYKSLAKNAQREANSRQQYKVKSFAVNNNVSCVICGQEHTVYNCHKFLQLDVNARYQEVKKLKLCINCLRSNHSIKHCKSESRCRKCNKLHNTLLHFSKTNHNTTESNNDNQSNRQTSNDVEAHPSTSNQINSVRSYCNVKNQNCILLSTARVTILDKAGNPHDCRVILDSASQSNFISKEFCSKLNLKTRKTESVVSGLNNTVSNINSIVDVKIHSPINAFSTTLSCLLIDKITTNIPCVSFEQKNISLPPNLILADPSFNISAKIDMLIGADTFWNLLCIGQIKLGKNAPILQKICLGRVVSGPIYLDKKSKLNTVCNLTVETNCDDALNHQLQKFWTIEDLPCKKYYSDEEAYCQEYFLKTSTRDRDLVDLLYLFH
ncbi:hypothetical protein NQ315_014373 [Exocentrus adspersus]|uniref:Peptidase aspartic putative domain-containing protein n=1 Tax=Exocentrus adspersus TaxID=1586481 RepID=A0AAV8V7N7_9CUCU|nr:hypothetical protein NQ315_014373 [Exocentrus adspersus]